MSSLRNKRCFVTSLLEETNTHARIHPHRNKAAFFLSLLAIINWGSGLDESTDHRLQATSPAPGGGTEVLCHRRAVLVEEHAEGLVGNQDWCLEKQNDDEDNSWGKKR